MRTHRSPTGTDHPLRPRAAAGFTVIEVIVVIVLLGVLTAMVAPPVASSWGSANLRESARGLRATVDYARAFAVTRQTTCRLVLESEDGRYSLMYQPDPLLEPETFEPVTADLQRPRSLRKGVRWTNVRIDPRGSADSEENTITFYPNGETDSALIELTDGNRSWTLRIAGSTGRTELIEGQSTQPLVDRTDLDR